MKNIFITFTAILLVSASLVSAQSSFQDTAITKLWEASDNLLTPESVLYDAHENVLYVSCVNHNPWSKDENGYIAKLSVDGKTINNQWATGLSAPKGMGITHGKLYVTNIDEVVEIRLETGIIANRYTHPRAINLNDIAVSSDGIVYVSDSKGDCIFKLQDHKLQILTDSPEVKASNGLFLEKGLLLCGQQNRIAALNLQTLEVSSFIENTGGIDGIEAIGIETYLFSDWAGHIYFAQPGSEKKLILDTTPLKINAADIGFDRTRMILFVPTFFHNSVAAYKYN